MGRLGSSSPAERLPALAVIEAGADRPVAVTLCADKGYDAADFVNELRSLNARPHVAQNIPAPPRALGR